MSQARINLKSLMRVTLKDRKGTFTILSFRFSSNPTKTMITCMADSDDEICHTTEENVKKVVCYDIRNNGLQESTVMNYLTDDKHFDVNDPEADIYAAVSDALSAKGANRIKDEFQSQINTLDFDSIKEKLVALAQ
jgi:hypothetical protein